MWWVGGVARIFVLVGDQQVQIDLKWQRAEGHGMPSDLLAATELIPIKSDRNPIRFLSVGPLVRAKFQSYGRGRDGDYVDLVFVCTHRTYATAVRDVAEEIHLAKREGLLEEVQKREPRNEEAVRFALMLDRSPSPEDQGSKES